MLTRRSLLSSLIKSTLSLSGIISFAPFFSMKIFSNTYKKNSLKCTGILKYIGSEYIIKNNLEPGFYIIDDYEENNNTAYILEKLLLEKSIKQKIPILVAFSQKSNIDIVLNLIRIHTGLYGKELHKDYLSVDELESIFQFSKKIMESPLYFQTSNKKIDYIIVDGIYQGHLIDRMHISKKHIDIFSKIDHYSKSIEVPVVLLTTDQFIKSRQSYKSNDCNSIEDVLDNALKRIIA